MPVEMLPARFECLNEFLRCMQETADYTSQGLGPWCADKYARDTWYKANNLAWDAFKALPVQDQRQWAEALFAACLGVAELGHVSERKNNAETKARHRIGECGIRIPTGLLVRLMGLTENLSEVLEHIASCNWTATTQPADKGFYSFVTTMGRGRELKLQLFTNDKATELSKVWDVYGQAWV